MKPLSAPMLLNVWERARGQDATRRALSLLAAACPEVPFAELAQLPIGERDARLLTLREWIFGPRLSGLAACPDCGERVELDFAVEQIRTDRMLEREFSLSASGYEFHARVLNSEDLAAASSRRELLERCVVSTKPDSMPEHLLAALEARLAEADPQANVQLALQCPSCKRSWLALFDIVAFFWREIEVWARRVLREVHALASAYGWSEAEILALSPTRRQIYLEMACQ